MRFRDLRSLALALTLAVVALTPAAARAQDYTDIWWGAGGTESGWGVNFVQNDDIVFATFYIYDVNRQPIWYSAAMTSTGSGSFTWPALPDAGLVLRQSLESEPSTLPRHLVGSSTFTPSSATTGTLNYSVTTGANMGAASKQIGRYAFKTILLGGNYSGAYSSTTIQCANSADNGTFFIMSTRRLRRSRSTDSLQFDHHLHGLQRSSCTLAGVRIAGRPAFPHSGCEPIHAMHGSTRPPRFTRSRQPRWESRALGRCEQRLRLREDASFSALLN